MNSAAQGPAERVEDLLERLADAIGVDADVEVTKDAEGLVGRFVGEDVAPVIGRHGQTLDAIQHVAYRIAYRGSDARGSLVVDAGGYRERRSAALRATADQTAEAAVRGGRPVALDATSALERKLVHEYLKGRPDVETYSEGQEPRRHLVVAPLLESRAD